MVEWFDLHEQFLLCRDRRQIPNQWVRHAIGDWLLAHHSSLPAITLLASDQTKIGWLLGYAISAQGILIRPESITVPVGADVSPADFERWTYEHGGRFIMVLITPKAKRVYLDPCGSLSAVYCPMLECVASTVTVVPRDQNTAELRDLVRLVGVPANSMYPLNLTPRQNVWRLLPNHSLDLSKWQAHRHWPKPEGVALSGDVIKAVNQIGERVRAHIKALVTQTPVLLRLTAGIDSRMLLACARSWIHRMTVFTSELEPPDPTSWLDCSTATYIARRHNLRYACLPYCPAPPKALEQWLIRTGSSVGEERGWRACTTFKQLPPGHADVIGLAGEIARGFYWRADDTHQTIIGPARLAARLRAGQHPLSRTAINSWLDALPSRDPFFTLDLFYIEQRLGCWGGIYPYGFAQDGRFQIFPLCHRAIIEAMLSLPIKLRRGDWLARQIIEREWPELLEYPINHARGLQRIGMAGVKARLGAARLANRLTRAARHRIATTRGMIAGWPQRERQRESLHSI